MSKERGLRAVPTRAWVLLAWLLIFVVLGVARSPHFYLGLILPMYWQVYLKKDLAPSWW